MFKKLRENAIKDWITSLMGVIIYAITTVFIWQKVMDFIWEGIAGYTLGTVLLMFPGAIKGFINRGISAWKGKQDSTTRNPEQPNGE